jgi:hypothetical protein
LRNFLRTFEWFFEDFPPRMSDAAPRQVQAKEESMTQLPNTNMPTNYCFYQGANALGADYRLKYVSFDDDFNFSGVAEVPNVYMFESPALAVYKGLIYCFFQGADQYGNNNFTINYVTFDGSNFSAAKQIPNAEIFTSPGLVVFNDLLYCFYQGLGGSSVTGDGKVHYFTFDGSDFSADMLVPTATIAYSPAVAVYNNRIYCFHQDTSEQLAFFTFDGDNFAPDVPLFLKAGINESPALAVHNNILYCMRQGKYAGIWGLFLEGNFSADKEESKNLMSHSPSLLAKGDKLIACFYQGFNAFVGAGDQKLFYSSNNGDEGKIEQVNIITSPATIAAPW